MWDAHGDRVQFYLVYIREAHAIDSAAPMGGGAAPIVEDPLHLAERKEVARTCMRAIELEDLDALVDDVTDEAARAYGGWPDRLVLIDVNGQVAYQSKPGPWGFDTAEFEQAILRESDL